MLDPANMSRVLISDFAINPEMIDLNNHLGDVGCHRIFSQAERLFHERVEIDEAYRNATHCSVYTVDSRVIFLREILLGEEISVSFQVLDLSNKAVHIALTMRNSRGDICAIHECLMMHVLKEGDRVKSYPFARYQLANMVQIFSVDKMLLRPEELSRGIGIRREVAL